MTPLYLPPRLTRNVAAGAVRTKRTVVLVDHVDLLHVGEVVGARAHLGIADALVRVLDVLGVHLLAVVEPHAAAEVEDVLGGRLLLPALGELRLGLEGVVDPDQVLVDERLPALPDVEPLHVRLDVRRQRRAGEREGAARLALGAGPPGEEAGRAQRRRAAAGEEGASGERRRASVRLRHGRSPSLASRVGARVPPRAARHTHRRRTREGVSRHPAGRQTSRRRVSPGTTSLSWIQCSTSPRGRRGVVLGNLLRPALQSPSLNRVSSRVSTP